MSGDVNQSADATAFIWGADEIREVTGAAVLLVHHEGKKSENGPAGSFVFEAAVDGAARLTDDDGTRTFKVTLMRDADPDEIPALNFALEEYKVRDGGPDDFGPVYSAAFRSTKPARVRVAITPDNLADMIAERKPGSVTELLAMAAPTPRRTILRYLKTLRDEGRAGVLQG